MHGVQHTEKTTTKQVDQANVLVMGLTFKENCPDMRNTKVVDLIAALSEFGIDVDAYDPWVASEDLENLNGFTFVGSPADNAYDGIIAAVGHNQFVELGVEGIRKFGKQTHVLYDLKNIIAPGQSDLSL